MAQPPVASPSVRLALLALVALVGCDCDAEPQAACATTVECEGALVCLDGDCVTAADGGSDSGVEPVDAGEDAEPPRPDAGSDMGCVSLECADDEACFDGLDNDCDEVVDEGCSCAPSSTARCLPGRTTPTAALCSWGEMACEGSGEFGVWGECTGAGSGGEGSLYGCRRIGIMGAPGANGSADFQAWLETQGAIATRFHGAASASELQRAELETFDLVIVDWLQRTYTPAEAETLAAWVTDGGGLMVMTGHDSGATADRHISLLVALGPTYDLAAGPINGPATLLEHPTTRTAEGAGTLPTVTFNGGLRTVVPAELAGTVVPMATIGDQVVGVAGPLGGGRVLLFGDEWIEFDSEWSSMPAIPQLWLNVVTWLSPEEPVVPACE